MAEEFEGGYAESELVEDLLSQGEEWNYLKFQAAQDAADLRLQMKQNAITDQRWGANMVQALAAMALGKAEEAFPKSRSLEHVAEGESISKTVNDDTSTTTGSVTMDQFSKVVDAVEKMATQVQTQMAGQQDQFMSALEALLARVEIEGE